MEGQNNIVEPKKKSPIGLIILMVILMIGCLVGGYFLNESGVFDKFQKDTMDEKSKKEEKKEEKKESVVTNYEVTDEKISNLISNLTRRVNACGLVELFVSDKKIEASDIDNMQAYYIASFDFDREKKEVITLDEFNKVVKKYLGKDYKFDPNTLNLAGEYCPFYIYNNDTKEFTKSQNTICGGECGPSTAYKIVKAVDTDGILKLDVKIIFGPKGGDKYYSDEARTNVIGTFDDDINGMFEKGSDYIFTFKLVDDYYAFVSSEPAK